MQLVEVDENQLLRVEIPFSVWLGLIKARMRIRSLELGFACSKVVIVIFLTDISFVIFCSAFPYVL
jgi:hypothetical protein